MKTTLDYFRYLLLCVVMCAFAACSNDDDNTSSSNTEIEIAEDMKTIAATGLGNEPKTITFTAKNDWTAIASHSWFDLSKRTGSAGEQSIIVTISDNDEFKTRTGTITIKDKVSGKSVDIIITQGEKNSTLTIIGNNGDDKSAGGTLIINSAELVISDTVNIKSNYDYSSIDADVDWLEPQEVAKNADGSTKYVFHANAAKLYAAAKYEAAIAKVSIAYQTATRTPATKEYLVKFEGITPTIKSDAEPAILEERGEEYKTTIHVTSNMVWTLGKDALTFAAIEINGDNNSTQYFETSTSITFTYNREELDTEEISDKLTFKDAEGKAFGEGLDVTYPGVGNDYVYLDMASFKLQDMLCIFDAQGEPDPDMGAGMFKDLTLDFKVKAANPENVVFYIARQKHQGASVWPTYINDYYEEVSSEVGNFKWGFVDEPEVPETRSSVETITKTLYVRSRGNEWDGSSVDTQDRYFAFFAVSGDKYPTFDDLFDGEGNLKEELEGKYVNCKQLKKGGVEDFVCDGLTGETLEAAATGQTFTFQYSGLDLTAEDWGASWFYDVEIEEGSKISGEYGMSEMLDETATDFGEFVDNEGTITIKVKPNTTGAERTVNFAICAGMLNDAVITYFTIHQAAQ